MPSEKIMAVAGIYKALSDELPDRVAFFDPQVQAAIIDAAVRIAMSTDTKDMGILSMGIVNPLRRDNLDGTTSTTVTDLVERAYAISPETGESIEDLVKGDHFAYPD